MGKSTDAVGCCASRGAIERKGKTQGAREASQRDTPDAPFIFSLAIVRSCLSASSFTSRVGA